MEQYGIAGELNPSSADIDQELRATRNRLRTKIATPADGKTDLQTLIDRSQAFAPPGLDLPPDVKMPASLVFRDASSRGSRGPSSRRRAVGAATGNPYCQCHCLHAAARRRPGFARRLGPFAPGVTYIQAEWLTSIRSRRLQR